MKLDLNRGVETTFPRPAEVKQPPFASEVKQSQYTTEVKQPTYGSEGKQPQYAAEAKQTSHLSYDAKPTPNSSELSFPIRSDVRNPAQFSSEVKHPPSASEDTQKPRTTALIKEYDFCEDETRPVISSYSHFLPKVPASNSSGFTAHVSDNVPPASFTESNHSFGSAPPTSVSIADRGTVSSVSQLPANSVAFNLANAQNQSQAQAQSQTQTQKQNQAEDCAPMEGHSQADAQMQAQTLKPSQAQARTQAKDSMENHYQSQTEAGSVGGEAAPWFPAYGSALREALERGQPAALQPKVFSFPIVFFRFFKTF
jgi:hypothetical protein